MRVKYAIRLSGPHVQITVICYATVFCCCCCFLTLWTTYSHLMVRLTVLLEKEHCVSFSNPVWSTVTTIGVCVCILLHKHFYSMLNILILYYFFHLLTNICSRKAWNKFLLRGSCQFSSYNCHIYGLILSFMQANKLRHEISKSEADDLYMWHNNSTTTRIFALVLLSPTLHARATKKTQRHLYSQWIM
jgi:hypothetical protein